MPCWARGTLHLAPGAIQRQRDLAVHATRLEGGTRGRQLQVARTSSRFARSANERGAMLFRRLRPLMCMENEHYGQQTHRQRHRDEQPRALGTHPQRGTRL